MTKGRATPAPTTRQTVAATKPPEGIRLQASRAACAALADERQVDRVLPQLVARTRRRHGASDESQYRSARRLGARIRQSIQSEPAGVSICGPPGGACPQVCPRPGG